MSWTKFLILLALLALFNAQHDTKTSLAINHLSVLLPWHGSGIILEAFGEPCVTWLPSHESLKLEPIYSNKEAEIRKCSSKVRIIPVGDPKGKVSGRVYAQGKKARVSCEVFIDQISHFSIKTTTKDLLVGEMETLLVQAQDKEDNYFITLDGLVFDWKSSSVDNRGSILLLKPNDESLNFATREEIASQGIVAKGMSVGEVNITLTLAHPFYKSVPTYTTPIYVLDKYVLEPEALLRVMPSSKTQYILKKSIDGQMEKVDMPNAQHSWIVGNPSVADITPAGLLLAKQLGMTEIRVKDKTFPKNEAKGAVTVVSPVAIHLDVKQTSSKFHKRGDHSIDLLDDDFVFVAGYQYHINVELMDFDGFSIHLDPDVKFSVELIDSKSRIFNSTNHNQQFSLATPQVEEFDLVVKLLNYPEYALEIRQKCRVYEKITLLHHGVIILPTDEGIRQQYQLVAKGGSGQYIWSTRNPHIVSVTQNGLVTSLMEGETELIVFDAINKENGDFRHLIVSVPHSIKIAPSVRETTLDSIICLQVQVNDVAGRSFSAFDALPLVWKAKNQHIYTSIMTDSCLQRGFKAQSLGQTSISVRYKKIRDKIQVGVYPPLKIANPTPPIVTLKSTMDMQVLDGPTNWNISSKITYSVNFANHLASVVIKSSTETERVYSITCLAFGTQEIEFVAKHEFEVVGYETNVVSVKTSYECAEPVKMRIAPVLRSGQEMAPIPLIDKPTFNVKNKEVVNVVASFYTAKGIKFADTSSLSIDWTMLETSNSKIVTKEDNKITMEMLQEGVVGLKASVLGYKVRTPHILSLSGEIELRITSSILLNPSWFLLFRHPENKYVIKSGGGSGKFEWQHNDTKIANFKRIDNNMEVQGTFEGYIGTRVYDSIFGTSSDAITKVSDVYSIRIKGPVLVEQGKSIVITLHAFDELGNEFDPSQFEHMRPIINRDNNAVANVTEHYSSKFEYVIHGIQPGIVKLIASTLNYDGKRFSSPQFTIQVYTPLTVQPSRLLMLPGTHFQVTMNGGPKQGVIETLYNLHTQIPYNVASVDKNGLITAKHYGSAILGIEYKFETLTFAQFNIPVNVVEPTGIIAPQNITLFNSKCVPISFQVESDKGLVDLVYLTAHKVKWSTIGHAVAFAYENTFIESLESGPITSSILCAKKLGSSVVKIEMEYKHASYATKRLSTEVPFFVEPKLCTNDICPQEILFAPNSTMELSPNKNIATVRSSLIGDVTSFSLDRRGILSSNHLEGSGILFLEDTSDGQSLVAKLVSAEPAFLYLESPDTKKPALDFALPLEQSVMIRLVASKSFGEVLNSFSGVDIKIVKSRDIVKVDFKKGHLVVRGVKEGTVHVEISTPRAQITVKFTVFGAINPINPKVLVGDVITFSIQEKTGIWRSEDPNVVSIEHGVATAKSSGKTRIIHTSQTGETSTTVHVSDLQATQVIPEKNIFVGKSFSVAIHLRNDFGLDIMNPPSGVSRRNEIECGSRNNHITIEKSILKENNTLICICKSSASFVSEKADLGLYVKAHGDLIAVPTAHVSIHGEDEEETEVSFSLFSGLFAFPDWFGYFAGSAVIIFIFLWVNGSIFPKAKRSRRQ